MVQRLVLLDQLAEEIWCWYRICCSMPFSSITSPMYERISAALAIGALVHGLERGAKRVKIAIRADARIAVGQPGAAKAPLRFENDEARAGELRLQVVGAANSGNAGPDDKDVEMLRSLRRRRCGAGFCQNVHGPVLF